MNHKIFGHPAVRVVFIALLGAVPMFAQIPQIIAPLTTIETTAIAAMRLLAVVLLILAVIALRSGHGGVALIETLFALAVGLGAQNIVTTVFPG